jgi:simple sugar transport system permease protein
MLCFRANIWNIGAEGQFIMGALLAGSFALMFPDVETKILLLFMFLVGFIGGAIWAFIPASLKTRLNVNEILVSLMLVYVAMLFIDFIVRGPLRDPMSFGFPLTKPYPEGALINKIPFPGIGYLGQLHYGILLIVLLIPLSWIFINKTLGGFKITVLGSAPKAAKFAGFKENSITMTVLLLSGGLAGIAGVVEVSANMGQLQPEVSFGYGFTAIIVAFLGRLNPIGILFAGITIATVKLGADNAQMTMGIPKVVTGLFEGILLFFLLTGETLQKYQIKWKRFK